jgi:hypothetical protein
MTRRTSLIAVLAALALLVPATTAGAGPAANKSGEELITYLDTGKLKVDERISFFVFCGAPAGSGCLVEATMTLKLPGPDVRPGPLSGSAAAQTEVEVYLEPNRAARKIIRAAGKKARMVTEVTATNAITGEVDTDSHTFRLKK